MYVSVSALETVLKHSTYADLSRGVVYISKLINGDTAAFCTDITV